MVYFQYTMRCRHSHTGKKFKNTMCCRHSHTGKKSEILDFENWCILNTQCTTDIHTLVIYIFKSVFQKHIVLKTFPHWKEIHNIEYY